MLPIYLLTLGNIMIVLLQRSLSCTRVKQKRKKVLRFKICVKKRCLFLIELQIVTNMGDTSRYIYVPSLTYWYWGISTERSAEVKKANFSPLRHLRRMVRGNTSPTSILLFLWTTTITIEGMPICWGRAVKRWTSIIRKSSVSNSCAIGAQQKINRVGRHFCSVIANLFLLIAPPGDKNFSTREQPTHSL